jgi:hypothetical protein
MTSALSFPHTSLRLEHSTFKRKTAVLESSQHSETGSVRAGTPDLAMVGI